MLQWAVNASVHVELGLKQLSLLLAGCPSLDSEHASSSRLNQMESLAVRPSQADHAEIAGCGGRAAARGDGARGKQRHQTSGR